MSVLSRGLQAAFAALRSRPRDGRLCIGDVVFIRQDGALAPDRSWE